MSEWSVDQVLSLAPDASAQRAARALAGDQAWLESGATTADDDLPPIVWGLCQGSGKVPYQICVDLTEPAYKCTCPSRKFPCKHALGLLLRWSSGSVPAAEAPGWVHEWHIGRGERAARAAARSELRSDPAATGGSRSPSQKAQARRADRIAAGLEELDRWLADQVRAGLSGLRRAGHEPWAAVSARLVDAQAGSLAGVVRRIVPVAGAPERLLGELALLRLLVSGYQRIDTLPPGLADTIKLKIGIPAPTEEVLAGPRVRDRWQIVGIRDELEEQLLVRRIWLRAASTGQPALVLSFGGPGQTLNTDLILGTEVEADLCFYPGALPHRALLAQRHAPPTPITSLAGRATIAAALRDHAEALATDPWIERWPMLLDAVIPARAQGGWHLVDKAGAGLPVDAAAGEPWRLVGAAGGRPVPVAGEWSVAGFRPLTSWCEGRLVRL
jgi:hypothetical protein